jgi:hypothetical protein
MKQLPNNISSLQDMLNYLQTMNLEDIFQLFNHYDLNISITSNHGEYGAEMSGWCYEVRLYSISHSTWAQRFDLTVPATKDESYMIRRLHEIYPQSKSMDGWMFAAGTVEAAVQLAVRGIWMAMDTCTECSALDFTYKFKDSPSMCSSCISKAGGVWDGTTGDPRPTADNEDFFLGDKS